MLARATVAMSASTDLIVERAVDLRKLLVELCSGLAWNTHFVLFCSEYRCEIIRHVCSTHSDSPLVT